MVFKDTYKLGKEVRFVGSVGVGVGVFVCLAGFFGHFCYLLFRDSLVGMLCLSHPVSFVSICYL